MIKPVLARRLIYPLHERLLKRPTFSYLAELERSQWLPRSGVQRLQERKLAGLLKSAYVHCPWHQARMNATGIDPDGPVSLEELRLLPTMDKQDAVAHGDQLVWHDVPGGAFKYNTGGSSGQPLIFYYGRRRQASDAAGRMRARRWWGVQPGDPEVYLWGAPVELDKTDWIKSLRDRLINQLVLNAFEMSPATMDEYAQAIQAFQPHCIYGYASSLALLAAHLLDRKTGLRLPKLKVVCTTGEPLFDYQRQLIGAAFGSPVANEFGSRDIGFTAHETPEGQMLLMSESIILEVLDEQGQPVPPGETGEAVMTALESFAQPFIRYRTGDMVRVADESCRAGRGLDVITEVLGRSTDFVVRADGAIMHALALIYVLRAVAGVGEFKIVQHTLRDIEVLVVPDASWQESGRVEIETGLRKRLGGDIHIDLRLVESIPAEASGKHRHVVSRVALSDGLKAATQVPIN
ncbi:MAG: phenylacetate--CoA ligase family protein [Gammaproteobacteria bacterium]|nr:phenylacetate--CoA ligase family protein [Gammaproteobacteria bacterium]